MTHHSGDPIADVRRGPQMREVRDAGGEEGQQNEICVSASAGGVRRGHPDQCGCRGELRTSWRVWRTARPSQVQRAEREGWADEVRARESCKKRTSQDGKKCPREKRKERAGEESEERPFKN